MTHNHVEKWACPGSAGARLSTRETGNEAKHTASSTSITKFIKLGKGHQKSRLTEKANRLPGFSQEWKHKKKKKAWIIF